MFKNKFNIEELQKMPKTIFRRNEAKEARFDVGDDANAEDGSGLIIGYPIVFNQRTLIGGCFYEEIDSHALDKCDLSDVKMLINHNNDMIPIARHRRGKRCTMDLEIDGTGLKSSARVDLANNEDARKLHSAIKRGDIDDMSFAFCVEVAGEEWSDLDKDVPTRRITQISKVFEISAVNDGAYPQTLISARSATLDNEKKALDNARAVALDNEKRAEQAEAALRLQKEKFLFMEEQKQK